MKRECHSFFRHPPTGVSPFSVDVRSLALTSPLLLRGWTLLGCFCFAFLFFFVLVSFSYSIFTPLCLLAEANIIAASSFFIAVNLLQNLTIEQAITENWLKAFKCTESSGKSTKTISSDTGKELNNFRNKIRQTVNLIAGYADKGLMDSALKGQIPHIVSSTSPSSASERNPLLRKYLYIEMSIIFPCS